MVRRPTKEFPAMTSQTVRQSVLSFAAAVFFAAVMISAAVPVIPVA